MLAAMGLLLDSFWRAAAYCLRPRVIALSLLPLVLMALLAMGLGYFYWDVAVQAMRTLLDASSLLASVWGWLQGWGLGDVTAVMAPDHASKEERQEIFRRHRSSLLSIGIVTGYLGAAPSIVWASGVVFAAAFFVLVPLAIWIYTLVFAFSSLWFTHYGLAALQRLRDERSANMPVAEPASSSASSALAPRPVDSPALGTAAPAAAALPPPAISHSEDNAP